MTMLTRRLVPVEFGHLRNEVDRLFSEFAPRTAVGSTPLWTPATDLRESEDAFYLSLDVPGLSADELDITVDDGVLTVSGERKSLGESPEKRTHRLERIVGRFSRTVRFNTAIDPDQVEASLENGVLTLEIGKSESSKPRRISVRSSASKKLHAGDGASSEVEIVESEA